MALLFIHAFILCPQISDGGCWGPGEPLSAIATLQEMGDSPPSPVQRFGGQSQAIDWPKIYARNDMKTIVQFLVDYKRLQRIQLIFFTSSL